MKHLKAIALVAGVLIIGKITLTILPGHINGKDLASVVWVLLLIGFYVLAAYSLRWARPTRSSEVRLITIFGVIISFLAGFLIHDGSLADKTAEFFNLFAGFIFLSTLIQLLWVRQPEVPMYDWITESGKRVPLIWKRNSGDIIARDEEGDLVLANAPEQAEANMKSIVFHFFPFPDTLLKARIDTTFESFPFPIIERYYLPYKTVILGISIVTGTVILVIWNTSGAMSILWGLWLYIMILFGLQIPLQNTVSQGNRLARKGGELAPLAIIAYEQSYQFFSTRRWIRFLTPFSWLPPRLRAKQALFAMGAAYLFFLQQRDKALETYQRILHEFPDDERIPWLLNVIRHIEAESSV